MRHQARILTPNPSAIPEDLAFNHRVEAVAEDELPDPPDEPVLYFGPDLPRTIESIEPGLGIEIELEYPEQLNEPILEKAVEIALGEDRDLKIRLR